MSKEENNVNKLKKVRNKRRRYCKRIYKKLNTDELEEYRNNIKVIKVIKEEVEEEFKEEESSSNKTCYKKAGNEGKKHSDKKLEIGFELFYKYKDQFTDNKGDGVWFEYPLISLDNKSKFSKYNQKKLNYLLSLYQPITVEGALGDIEGVKEIIKNLHNIFNPNLKSSLRGRKSLKALCVEKVVDIAVICDGKIVKIVEVNISNKLKKSQIELINNLYPETLEEI